MTVPLLVEHPKLPRAPRKASERTLRALAIYDRIEARPQYPIEDARRRVLAMRLRRLIAVMEPAEMASYYAGLNDRREQAAARWRLEAGGE